MGTAVGAATLPEALDGAWLAVESVPERLDIKIPLWGDIDQAAPPGTIFATNSSSFPSRLMAEMCATRRACATCTSICRLSSTLWN